MWNQEVSRTIDAFKKPFKEWPEMTKVVAYGEAKPEPPMSIQETIKLAFLDYLKVVRSIAHMSENDIDLIHQVDLKWEIIVMALQKELLHFLKN